MNPEPQLIVFTKEGLFQVHVSLPYCLLNSAETMSSRSRLQGTASNDGLWVPSKLNNYSLRHSNRFHPFLVKDSSKADDERIAFRRIVTAFLRESAFLDDVIVAIALNYPTRHLVVLTETIATLWEIPKYNPIMKVQYIIKASGAPNNLLVWKTRGRNAQRFTSTTRSSHVWFKQKSMWVAVSDQTANLSVHVLKTRKLSFGTSRKRPLKSNYSPELMSSKLSLL